MYDKTKPWEAPDPIQIEIDAGQNANPRTEAARRYIGASAIGHDCDAYLALCLRGFSESNLSPRIRRIFTLGSTLENVVVSDLRTAGYSVQEIDPATGKQWRWVLFGGHVACSADGKIQKPGGPERLLECKTMNMTKFNAFRKHGLAKSHPTYIGQAQMLMGMSGIKSLLLVAYCKNTSRYGSEVIEFSQSIWDRMLSRIEHIAGGGAERYRSTEQGYPCDMCHKKSACWDMSFDVARECEKCAFAQPDEVGTWYCTKNKTKAVTACSSWRRFVPQKKQW